jgi:putative DNA primase/helicase
MIPESLLDGTPCVRGGRVTAAEIAKRLHARSSRVGWLARCPAHKDRNPSLSIREDNGKILLHCFANCTVESICSALKIRVRDLFAEPGAVETKPRIVREAEKQIAHLRTHLTPRERVLPVTVVYCEPANLDASMDHALKLAVEGEIVQCVLVEDQQ